MKSLRDCLREAADQRVALGHFNISDLVALRAIVEAAREMSALGGSASGGNLPVIIGTSEGERTFIGPRQAVALVQSLRQEYDWPIFLNADHTHSLAKIKEAVAAGYDAVLFDGSQLPFAENVRQTKAVVEYVKSVNPEIVIEGELGYIGSSSEVLKEVPAGVSLSPEDLTSPEQAIQFVKATGVEILAPAVGNVHGIIMSGDRPSDPPLDIKRIKTIKEAVKIPLVLHGASGNTVSDVERAVAAGIAIVHVNTELRLAWRRGLEQGLRDEPDEVAPYKIYPAALAAIKQVVLEKLRILNSSGR